MTTAARSSQQTFAGLVEAIKSAKHVDGLSHKYYRYPARFSPVFVREAIKTFTTPGDIVLDPFMGGGTTLVESRALGRIAVGSDVSSLAVFLAKTKTTVLTEDDRHTVRRWADSVVANALSLRNCAERANAWIANGYQRNVNTRSTWRIRKTVELALAQLKSLTTDNQRSFARCAVLRTAQWALDCRKTIPTVAQFRSQFLDFTREMILGSTEFASACDASPNVPAPLCLHQTALTLDSTYNQIEARAPRLVLTSPPYPGVHVVYHRWQVLGRRETPAAFWIAGSRDGAGSSFYTFGDRHQSGLSDYFDTALQAFRSISKIADSHTTVVQMLAFSEHGWQLERYLKMMSDAGFVELRDQDRPGFPLRIWREVPNRKWYADRLGASASSSEVVLFHRLAR